MHVITFDSTTPSPCESRVEPLSLKNWIGSPMSHTTKFCRVSDNTSWCNVPDCVLGTFNTYDEALDSLGPGEWVELLTQDEIKARTY